MTLDPEFLQMLVCPATRKPMCELSADALRGLNAAIQRGGVVNRGGAAVTAPLQGGLQPQGEGVVYPIQDGIPILLTTEAIPFASVEGATVEGKPRAR